MKLPRMLLTALLVFVLALCPTVALADGESEEAVEFSVPSAQEFCDTGDSGTQVDVHEDGSVWCSEC